MKSIRSIFLLVALALFLTSCANKSLSRYDAIMGAYDSIGVSGAIAKIQTEEAKEDLYGDNTRFLYEFDLGMLFHYNRDYRASIEHFKQALQINEELYAKSVTEEIGAMLLNDNARDYRPRPFELLVLYEIQVLNYLALGDVENAAVEVRAAQVAMEELYQKDNKKVNDNGFLRYLGAVVYELDNEKNDASVAYYKSVKAYEESKTKLPDEVWGFVCNRLKAEGKDSDLEEFGKPTIELEKAGEDLGAEIVVLAYGGHSPILGERRYIGDFINGQGVTLTIVDDAFTKDAAAAQFQLPVPPLPDISGTVPIGEQLHIEFAIPDKREKQFAVKGFDINFNGDVYPMEPVLNSDDELTQNLEDDRTATITRTAIRAALKAFAVKLAQKAAESKGGALGGLAAGLAGNAVAGASEQADLRLGIFLPDQIYMSRIPVAPGTHEVLVDAVSANGQKIKTIKCTVPVKAGKAQFLIIPAVF